MKNRIIICTLYIRWAEKMKIKHKIINIRPRTVLQFIQPLTWKYLSWFFFNFYLNCLSYQWVLFAWKIWYFLIRVKVITNWKLTKWHIKLFFYSNLKMMIPQLDYVRNHLALNLFWFSWWFRSFACLYNLYC